MIDRCNFPLPPLFMYCPQYQYREMWKSDIWSYYALSPCMKDRNKSSVSNIKEKTSFKIWRKLIIRTSTYQGHLGHQGPQGEEKAIVQDLAFHCKPFYFPGLRLMWHLCNWLFLLQSNDGTITPHKFPGQIEFKEMLWEISGNDEDAMLVQVIWGSSEEHLKPNECLWLHNRYDS